jgi:hypothetical protein
VFLPPLEAPQGAGSPSQRRGLTLRDQIDCAPL